MDHHIAEMLASVLIVGVLVQWVGWYLRIPALILLIVVGFVMGPLMGWLKPTEDFGDLLQPMISLSVAVILFEGGLNLQWHEFKKNSSVIYRLISWSVVLTFLLGSVAAHYVVGLSWPVALMFGAIIIVTGPTVIMPLLKQANLQKRPAALLRWEGIVNDPIGALLVVLIYSYYVYSEKETLAMEIVAGLGISLLVSLALGAGIGLLLARLFRQGAVPEYLKSPLVLMAVLLVFTLANRVQSEAGLLATTILGITLANQRLDTLHELKRFKEYVTILLVSSTFIILTADIQPEILQRLGWQSWLLLALVIFVIRPVSIYLSTLGTGIDWRDRLLIGWIAPRGIVAAAVAGLFGAQLTKEGYEGAEMLLPLVFALIILTVTFHGLTIGWLARRLGLASTKPDGVMMIGASPWTISLAAELHKNEIPVLLIDTRWKHLRPARMQGISTHYGELLSERTEEILELSHITKMLAVTPNEAYNTLICSRFAPELGHRNVYEAAWKQEGENQVPRHTIQGYSVFGKGLFFEDFTNRFNNGWQFETTNLSDKYSLDDMLKEKPENTVLIAAVLPSGDINFYPWGDEQLGKKNAKIISYVAPSESGNAS